MNPLSQALEQYNITPEDLEKAASVRIFQKVADAESIDLDQLSESQLDALFAHFEANVLPEIVGGEPSTEAKVASLSQDDVFTLFDKQADAEGLDLSGATDEQLADALEFFMENVLPAMAENGFEPVGSENSAEVEEAQAKLAEADILGRQMARGYADEMGKIAGGEMVHVLNKGSGHTIGNTLRQGGTIARRAVTGGFGRGVQAATIGAGVLGTAGAAALGYKGLKGRGEEKETTAGVQLSAEDVEILSQLAYTGDMYGLQKAAGLIKSAAVAQIGSIAPGVGERLRGVAARGMALARTNPKAALALLGGGGVAALGGGLALAHHRKSKSMEKETTASAVDFLVEDRAAELAAGWLTANGYGS